MYRHKLSINLKEMLYKISINEETKEDDEFTKVENTNLDINNFK